MGVASCSSLHSRPPHPQRDPHLGNPRLSVPRTQLGLHAVLASLLTRRKRNPKPANMGVDGCTKCIKYILFFFNFIFWVSSPFIYWALQMLPRSAITRRPFGFFYNIVAQNLKFCELRTCLQLMPLWLVHKYGLYRMLKGCGCVCGSLSNCLLNKSGVVRIECEAQRKVADCGPRF